MSWMAYYLFENQSHQRKADKKLHSLDIFSFLWTTKWQPIKES